MKPRFYFLFTFFSILFLFYPGDSDLFRIFAFNRDLFSKTAVIENANISIPVLINTEVQPNLSAQGVYIVDKNSFTPVYERNARKRLYPASTTKIITALVAYDVLNLNKIVNISKLPDEGQMMGLIPGERISVEYLLYGALIHSGNDAAYALAHEYGYDKFIDLMNKKAEELQMTDSNFENPIGYDSANHYSTPFDMALAAREILENNYLSKIVSIKEITISDADFKYFHQLANINQLLGEISGIGGVKTGYTQEARQNLVSFYKHNDREYIIAIMNSEDRFEDTLSAVNWINSNIEYVSIN
ncbi:MAG: serine hydrolase [Patescibacteria group bacterium]